MIFSHRYHRALTDNRLTVSVPNDARPKLVTCLLKYNTGIDVRRDPDDSWVSNSSVTEEAILELLSERGWEGIPGTSAVQQGEFDEAFKHLVRRGDGPLVFDFIEMAMGQMDNANREQCRIKINQIFDLHGCSWRITDGEFFKLDADFMGERLAASGHDALAANRFVGAAQEYAKARQELASGDVKDGIFYAGKSFESVMKVITGKEHASADQLIKAMQSDGYFNDLPESMRVGFSDQVMKTLPFLRNKLAGHGQGAAIIDVPVVYGELAVQLAAAFHNFLISKHLERSPPLPQPKEPVARPELPDDDILF